MNNIYAKNILIGINTYISPSAIIQGVSGPAEVVVIGDGTYIGDNVEIFVDNLTIGDYCKIHKATTFHGHKPLSIGHNAWIGQNTIIDSLGGVQIGNNCGIGAYSQLWSHIRYGDPLEGCNYNSSKELIIQDDVWFVGHCIVSPITAKSKSMALVGSVITKDMEENHIYGGCPARDLTGKVPSQFSTTTVESRRAIMSNFSIPINIKLIENDIEMLDDSISYFNINSRKYTKRGTSEEYQFMKLLQKNLIKFTPYAN